MKRILLTLIAACFAISTSAQTEALLGISLGKKYTCDELISLLEGKASFSNQTLDPSVEKVDVNLYFFTGFNHNELTYNLAIKTGPDDVLFYVSLFQIADGEIITKYALTQNYIKAKTALFAEYPDMLLNKENKNKNNYDTYKHSFSETVELRIVSDDEMFEIDFTDLEALRNSVTANMGYPTVQDSFFGVKFEEKVKDSFASAVGSKGTYAGWDNSGEAIVYNFHDIRFGGSTWDFGKFFTYKDQFFRFEVNDSFPDGYGNDQERKDAKAEYDNLIEVMKKKYGAISNEINEGGDFNAFIYGNNHISIRVFNEKLRSVGGEYRRYVGIEYVYMPLYEEQNEAAEDEF